VLDRLDELGRFRLPLRTAGVRVGTGLTALGNGHGCVSSFVFGSRAVTRLPEVLFGVGSVFSAVRGLQALQCRPPGVEHIARLTSRIIRVLLPCIRVESGAIRSANRLERQ